ncbi:unnamed protein product [Diamesa hyperborea]
MDISDLLSFKPESTPKRKQDELDDPEVSRAKPIKKSKFSDKPPKQNNELTDEEKLKIIQMVEDHDDDGAESDVLDDGGLKKLALLFEKRILKNQVTRLKHPENPEKFMDSEIELNDVIQQLHAVSTVPDLYPLLVSLNVVTSLLELLSHPNTDISVAIIDIIQELTDVDVLHESEEGAEKLIDCLKEQKITKLLIANMDRLDESVKEEADGVHSTMAIFENLTEIRPEEMCMEIAEQGLLQWILKRLRIKMFDPNKLYCSEILSILLQNTNENRILLGNVEGIDILLQQLATYKRHDPSNPEEQEYMENLFNCLCSSLLAKENRSHFLKGEGIQLMNLMLREKKLSRNGSLKVLDYCMTGTDGKENSAKFVDILGLRTIFPLFMKTPKKSKQRLLSADEHEEHVCSIISSMLRNTKAAQKQRLLSKFVENDFEKVDRLIELHLKYLEKVEQVEEQLKFKRPGMEEFEDEEDEAEANYLKRLSGGLFTLQLIDYIILEICVSPDAAKIKLRLNKLIKTHPNASLKTIRNVMREYAGNLGESGDAEWREQEKIHIISLIDRF